MNSREKADLDRHITGNGADEAPLVLNRIPVTVCSACGARVEDGNEGPALYECGRCGQVFNRENSADGDSSRCPDCGVFSAKVGDSSCDECDGGPLEAEERLECREACGEAFETEEAEAEHFEAEHGDGEPTETCAGQAPPEPSKPWRQVKPARLTRYAALEVHRPTGASEPRIVLPAHFGLLADNAEGITPAILRTVADSVAFSASTRPACECCGNVGVTVEAGRLTLAAPGEPLDVLAELVEPAPAEAVPVDFAKWENAVT